MRATSSTAEFWGTSIFSARPPRPSCPCTPPCAAPVHSWIILSQAIAWQVLIVGDPTQHGMCVFEECVSKKNAKTFLIMNDNSRITHASVPEGKQLFPTSLPPSDICLGFSQKKAQNEPPPSHCSKCQNGIFRQIWPPWGGHLGVVLLPLYKWNAGTSRNKNFDTFVGGNG